MTLNLIETVKTSIYSPKHTKNTKIHFMFSMFKKLSKSIFPNKNKFKNKTVFYAVFFLHYLYFVFFIYFVYFLYC